MAKGRKMSTGKAPAVAMAPINRAGSTLSDSSLQPRPDYAVFGPSTPDRPINPSDTPQS